MGKLYTPQHISNIYSAVNKINENWDDIEEALDSTLARLDVQDNQMETDLDLNSNDLLNVRNIVLNSSLLEPKEISGGYYLEKDDLYRVLRCTGATMITLPYDDAFGPGWYCHVQKATDQSVTFQGQSGDVTIESVDNSNEILEQWGWCTAYKLTADHIWSLMGNMA